MKILIKLSTYIIFLLFVSCNFSTSPESENVGSENISETQDITFVLLSISPPGLVMQPNAVNQFSGAGGSGSYTFSIESGLGSITAQGLFTAPATTGITKIRVEDSSGNTAFAVITIGTALLISPSTTSVGTSQTKLFQGVNGVPPYTFSKVSGGGTINATTGLYTAPASAGSAVVRVTDNEGNSANATISVVNAVSTTFARSTLAYSEVINLSTTGGVPPYTYSLISGSGSLNTSTGQFTAGTTTETVTIRTTDNIGITDNISFSVKPGPELEGKEYLPVDGTYSYSVNNQTPPLTFSIDSGSGSIDGSGNFTAPSTDGTTVIKVVDADGLEDTLSITIFYPLEIDAGGIQTCVIQKNSSTTSETKCFGAAVNHSLGNYFTLKGLDSSMLGDNLDPIDIGMTDDISSINTNNSSVYNCVQTTTDKVKCWGYGSYGVLGRGNSAYRGTTIGSMGANVGYAILADDLDSTISDDKRLAMGEYFNCAILTGGELQCWGYNNQGQLGLGDTARRMDSIAEVGTGTPNVNLGAGLTAKMVSAGRRHVCAILNDDTVKCWGDNSYGNLGYEDVAQRGHDAATTPDLLPTVNLGTGRTAKYISAGYLHNCAILDDDSVKCWGYNPYGNLGTEDNVTRGDDVAEMGDALPTIDLGLAIGEIPVSLHSGYYHTCALLSTNKAKCWGYNAYGQLGIGASGNRGDNASEMGTNLPYVAQAAGTNIVKIKASMYHTCVLNDNNDLRCYGYNIYGSLGQGHNVNLGASGATVADNVTPIDFGTGVTIDDFSTGYTTCAVLSDDSIKCFGNTPNGQTGEMSLGLGDEPTETISNIPVIDLGTGVNAKEIYSGSRFNCALMMDDRVKCWGYGSHGALGMGSSASYGWTAAQMGDSLLYTNLGTGLTLTKVANDGVYHMCGLFDNNEMKCWGYNAYGNLGQGDTSYYGRNPGNSGDFLPAINLGTGRTATDVSTGAYHSCAILDDGNVKCWGYNPYGNLGYEDNVQRGDDPGEMGDALAAVDIGTGRTAKSIYSYNHTNCIIRDDDSVVCWGYNNYGQLGMGATGNIGDDPGEMGDNLVAVDFGAGLIAVKLAMGTGHVCALLNNNQVKCWGYNGYGQLGVGNTTSIGTNPLYLGDNMEYFAIPNGREVLDVTAGDNHTCVLLDNNQMSCVGRNVYGELGIGNNYTAGSDGFSIGENLTVTVPASGW